MRLHKSLKEAVEVQGAELIGSAHGYDLFKILTWEAAQEFVLERNTNHKAGQSYTQNESTFNSNVNETVNLFFFVLENTNKVVGAAITGAGNSNITVYNKLDNTHLVLPNINILFENEDVSSNVISRNYNDIPLYLIPDINLPGDQQGCIIENNELKGVLACLTEERVIPSFNLYDKDIWKVWSYAFTYGVKVEDVIIPALNADGAGLILQANAFQDVNQVLISASEEEVNAFQPGNWPTDWAGDSSVEYDYGLTDEDREARLEAKAREKANFIIEDIKGILNDEYYTFSGDPLHYGRGHVQDILSDLYHYLEKINELDDYIKEFIPIELIDDLKARINIFEKTLFDLEVYWFENLVDRDIPDNLTISTFENDKDKDIEDAINQGLDWIRSISKNDLFNKFKNLIPTDKIEKVKKSQEKWYELEREFEKIKEEREAHKLRYKIEGNHVVITGTRKGIKEIEIPEEIEGKPVTIIAPYAFFGNSDLENVVLPSSIQRVEKGAFTECENLNVYEIKDFLRRLKREHPVYISPNAFNQLLNININY